MRIGGGTIVRIGSGTIVRIGGGTIFVRSIGSGTIGGSTIVRIGGSTIVRIGGGTIVLRRIGGGTIGGGTTVVRIGGGTTIARIGGGTIARRIVGGSTTIVRIGSGNIVGGSQRRIGCGAIVGHRRLSSQGLGDEMVLMDVVLRGHIYYCGLIMRLREALRITSLRTTCIFEAPIIGHVPLLLGVGAGAQGAAMAVAGGLLPRRFVFRGVHRRRRPRSANASSGRPLQRTRRAWPRGLS